MRLGSSPRDGSEPEGDRCARQEASVSEVQMFNEKWRPAEDQWTSKVQKMLRQALRQPSVMLLCGYLVNKPSFITFGSVASVSGFRFVRESHEWFKATTHEPGKTKPRRQRLMNNKDINREQRQDRQAG